MQRLSAILLTAWVFVVSPLLCTSGLALHVCDAQDACQSCQTEQCPDGHGCHKDPCRIDATLRRPELPQTNPCLVHAPWATLSPNINSGLFGGATTPISSLTLDTGQPPGPVVDALTLPLLV